MLKKIGSWIGSIKKYFRDDQNQVSEIINQSIVNEIQDKKEIKDNKETNDK